MMNAEVFSSFCPRITMFNHLNENNALPKGESYGRRLAANYELEYVLWGNGKLLINDVEYPTTRGTVFFRKPGMWVEGIGCYYSYSFHFDFNCNMETPEDLETLPVVCCPEEAAELEACFTKLYQIQFNRDTCYHLTAKSLIMTILSIMVTEWGKEKKRSKFRPTVSANIEKSIHYIEEHYQEEIKTQRLAQESGYSLYHFIRVFKEYTGMTPVEYINMCRVTKAKALLVESSCSIDEIVKRCGFNNNSYFFRIFKKYVGATPSLYRKTYSGRHHR